MDFISDGSTHFQCQVSYFGLKRQIVANGHNFTGNLSGPIGTLSLGSPTAHLVNRFPFALRYLL